MSLTLILQIFGPIVGLVAGWLLWDFLLKPLVQKFTNWVTTIGNESAISNAAQNNQNQNNQDQKDQDTRNKILDGLDPKK